MNQLVVIGNPIEQSLTPVIYDSALKELGLEKQFKCKKLKIKSNCLEDFIDRLKQGDIYGCNITIPHKTSVIQYLDRITDTSQSIQAVNVIYRKNGQIIGDNTDVVGFKNSLIENNIETIGKKAVIVGAGGVARAAAFALSSENIQDLVILNRTGEKAEELAKWIKEKLKIKTKSGILNDIEKELQNADILINCTPVGMKGTLEKKSIVPPKNLRSDLIVIDMVYNPIITKLIKDAKKNGAKTIDGSRMFLHQGIAAFELLTNHKPSINTMENALTEALK